MFRKKSTDTDNPSSVEGAFRRPAPEPLKSADQSRWYSAIHFEADTILRAVRERMPSLGERRYGDTALTVHAAPE